MIKFLMIIPVVALLMIAFIGAYLTPDDLQSCGQQPSSRVGCQKVDAIVAVSGGNTSLRTQEAIELYENGWAKYLIFSGAAKDETGPSNAAVMRTQALDNGVPTEAIFVEESSRTTHENAQFVETIFKQKDVSSIIVVTSPYHQRRAGLEFHQKLGDEVIIYNHPATNDPDWPWYWWLTPRGWWLAVGELVKIGATQAGGAQ